MASNSNNGPSIAEILGKFYQAFERKIDSEGLTHAKGHLIFAVFVLALNIGIIATMSMLAVANSAFGIGLLVVFLTIIAFLCVLPFFIWIIIPGYRWLYGRSLEIITDVLAYQTAVVFIAIVIAVITNSIAVAVSGIVIFGIIAFVYPFIRTIKKGSSTVEEINSTLGLVLKIITILCAIFQLILGYAHLL